jgi:hypothetical protein
MPTFHIARPPVTISTKRSPLSLGTSQAPRGPLGSRHEQNDAENGWRKQLQQRRDRPAEAWPLQEARVMTTPRGNLVGFGLQPKSGVLINLVSWSVAPS